MRPPLAIFQFTANDNMLTVWGEATDIEFVDVRLLLISKVLDQSPRIHLPELNAARAAKCGENRSLGGQVHAKNRSYVVVVKRIPIVLENQNTLFPNIDILNKFQLISKSNLLNRVGMSCESPVMVRSLFRSACLFGCGFQVLSGRIDGFLRRPFSKYLRRLSPLQEIHLLVPLVDLHG